ncbi:MAG: hypothetical protein FWH17_09310 [Oscillospiraceae bacterium]|nr:hypothetical protein [Oscillospiraceae bacterium]
MIKKKRTVLVGTILLHTLLILLVYMFQGAIFPFLRIGGLVPLMLPVAVTGIALYEGRDMGGICGIFAGVLCDISFNQPVGTFTVLLTLVGLGIGILSEMIILSSFVTYYIGCAAVLTVCAFVQMIPVIAQQNDIPSSILMSTAIGQTTYSLIVAFPIWFFVRALGKRRERLSPAARD